MTFELTDSLKDDILFAMENQGSAGYVDAENDCVVFEEQMLLSDLQDEDVFYPVPEWTSADGFSVMEDFANNLHSPLAREKLKKVLSSGRGVFRNFKDVIKAFPEVERRFHLYKDERMKERINDWYNDIRESWGLERLAEQEQSEETDDLVCADFVFSEFSLKKDKDEVLKERALVEKDFSSSFQPSLGNAIAFMWRQLSDSFDWKQKEGFVCKTQSDEFAACLLTVSCPPSTNNCMLITDFFVEKNYRGLGIGAQLLDKCIASLKKRGIQNILITNTIITAELESLLTSRAFKKLGSGFYADLI